MPTRMPQSDAENYHTYLRSSTRQKLRLLSKQIARPEWRLIDFALSELLNSAAAIATPKGGVYQLTVHDAQGLARKVTEATAPTEGKPAPRVTAQRRPRKG